MNELIDHAPEKPHSRVSCALTGTPAFHTDVMSRSRVWAETPPLDTKLEAGVTSAPGPVGTPLPGRAFELQRREGQPGGEGSHTSEAGRLERDTGICQRGLRTETCWLSSRSPPSSAGHPPRAPGRAGRPVQGQNESCSLPCKPPPPSSSLLVPSAQNCHCPPPSAQGAFQRQSWPVLPGLRLPPHLAHNARSARAWPVRSAQTEVPRGHAGTGSGAGRGPAPWTLWIPIFANNEEAISSRLTWTSGFRFPPSASHSPPPPRPPRCGGGGGYANDLAGAHKQLLLVFHRRSQVGLICGAGACYQMGMQTSPQELRQNTAHLPLFSLSHPNTGPCAA